MYDPEINEVVTHAFTRAHRGALLSSLWAAIRRRPATLLPFEEVRTRLYIRGQRDRGMQTVPLAQIIGSQGRSNDFDRFFRPVTAATRERWTSIVRAHLDHVSLPYVELYKISDIYFVRDGNHRVSVARQQGRMDIEAHVIELVTDVPLDAELGLHNLVYKEELSDFLEWTNLAETRPGHNIRVSDLGGYLDLIRHINRHRQQLMKARQDDVSPQEAITYWYDTGYQPVIAAIRQAGLAQAYPQRTETDLYIAVMYHREQLSQLLGYEVPIEEAVADFVARFGARSSRFFRRRPTLQPVAAPNTRPARRASQWLLARFKSSADS